MIPSAQLLCVEDFLLKSNVYVHVCNKIAQGLKRFCKDLMDPFEAKIAPEPAHAPHPASDALLCPACDSPVGQERYAAIKAKFKHGIRLQLDSQRRQLHAYHEKKTAEALEHAEQRAKAAASAAIDRIAAERDALIEKAAAAQMHAEEATRAAVAVALAAEHVARETQEKKLTQQRDAAVEKARDVAERSEHAQREAVLNATKTAQAGWQCKEEELVVARDVAAKRAALAEDRAKEAEAAKKQAVSKAIQELRIDHESSMATNIAELEAAKAQTAAVQSERDAAIEKASKVESELGRRVAEKTQAEVVKVREILELEHEKQRMNQAAEAARERESLRGKVDKLQRQLDKKTANELGGGAEIDLYERLRELFPEDNIERVPKGEPGGDIKVGVRCKGLDCGLILIDSKNRKSWQRAFATKLRSDQVEAGAEHSVLSTTAFPSGQKELCVESEVIVASPGRVPDIVRILRMHMIKLGFLRAGNEERETKREALYLYITSENYRLLTEEAERANQCLQQLDVEEKRAHDKVWKNRGTLLKQQERAIMGVEMEVTAIVAAAGGES